MHTVAMGLSVVFLFLPNLSAVADVIPSRLGGNNRTEKDNVSRELSRRGMLSNEANAQVGEMSARDLEYFSQDGRRIQLATGLTMEEWILGAGFGALLGIIILALIL